MAKFTIGLDAEFCFTHKTTKRFVPANTIISANTTAQFGTDGCSSIAEIRPKYADHPVELVANIRRLFQRRLASTPRLEDVNWFSKGRMNGYSMGAHIHIGSPELVRIHRDARLSADGRIAEQKIIKMFGEAFDAFVLPSATLLGDALSEKERRESYGFMSDIRHQDWGYEYRSCSSFLASPASTLFVLTVAWVVAHEFLDETLPEFSDLKLVRGDFSSSPFKACSAKLDERFKYLMNLNVVRNDDHFKNILDVGYHMIKKGACGIDVYDMKKSWRLKSKAIVENVETVEPRLTKTFSQFWRELNGGL